MTQTKDLRAPIALARDEYMLKGEGQKMSSGTASGEYLRNRIEAAFCAGWNAAEDFHRDAHLVEDDRR